MTIDTKLNFRKRIGVKIGTAVLTSMFAFLSYLGVGCKAEEVKPYEETKEQEEIVETYQEPEEKEEVVVEEEKPSELEIALKKINDEKLKSNMENVLQDSYFKTDEEKIDFINRALNLYSVDISEYNQKGKNFSDYLFNDVMSKDFTIEQKLDALEATLKLNNLPGEHIDHLLEAITPRNSDNNEEIKIGDKIYVDEDSDIKELQNHTNPFNPLSNSTLNELYGESEIYAILINGANELTSFEHQILSHDISLAYVVMYLDKLNVPKENRLIVSSSNEKNTSAYNPKVSDYNLTLEPTFYGESEFKKAGYKTIEDTLKYFVDENGKSKIDKNDIIGVYLSTEGYGGDMKHVYFFSNLIDKQQWINFNRKCSDLAGWVISADDSCHAGALAFDFKKFNNVTSFFANKKGETGYANEPPFGKTLMFLSTGGKFYEHEGIIFEEGINKLDIDNNPFKISISEAYTAFAEKLKKTIKENLRGEWGWKNNPFIIGPESKNLTNEYFKK